MTTTETPQVQALRRDLVAARATATVLRELLDTVEDLRSTYETATRDSVLAAESDRLVRQIRERQIDAGQIAARLVDLGVMP